MAFRQKKERLIGYDVRTIGKEVESLWPTKEKKKYLLRSDVVFPYSCDNKAWPSIFDVVDSLGRPQSYSVNAEFWDNLYNLKCYIKGKIPDNLSYEVVCVTYCGTMPESELKGHYLYLLESEIGSHDEKWEFVGFDVADNGFESATAGMGHLDFEFGSHAFHESRYEFSKYINDYGLFQTLKYAIEFCGYENNRVPEHSPFFPFGIWIYKGAIW